MIQKADYIFEKPDAQRDEPLVRALFESNESQVGLFCMGNPESSVFTYADVPITEDLQANRVTWVIRKDDVIIGFAWINKEDADDLQAPSLHLAIKGDENAAQVVIKEAVRYAYCNLPYATLYSRHLVPNDSVHVLDKKIGFEKDGDAYEDDSSQKWQNVALVL